MKLFSCFTGNETTQEVPRKELEKNKIRELDTSQKVEHIDIITRPQLTTNDVSLHALPTQFDGKTNNNVNNNTDSSFITLKPTVQYYCIWPYHRSLISLKSSSCYFMIYTTYDENQFISQSIKMAAMLLTNIIMEI